MRNEYPKMYLYKRIIQAKLFMDAHFAEPMDLELIADEAYFSKFHFIRLFKSIYGKTPHQYLIQVRVQQARQLLQKGMPVSATCFAVGFDSVSSFTALFRKQVGVAPSRFQQYFLSRQAAMIKTPLHFVPNCFAEQNGWLQNSNFQEAI